MTASEQKLLVVENLSVQIPVAAGVLRAVDRVSLTLDRGRTLALVGESGSGKSMFCRALMGIQPGRATLPGNKRVLFDGRDLTQLPAKELSRIRGSEIGIVLQNPMSSLNPVLTIGSQIAEPIRYHLGYSRAKASQRALQLLQAVGIPQPEERLKCYPHQLSGGMRQRVAIAIALSCDPKLLIADEPTSALDVTVQADILNLLARLQRERNMALLLVTHDLALVAGRAHETAVMYAGRLVERAPTATLFAGMRMPYTEALFQAIPRIYDSQYGNVCVIGGQPPDLAASQPGCLFAPRCPRAGDRCRTEEPPLIHEEVEHHHYACWFPCPNKENADWRRSSVTTDAAESPPFEKGGLGGFASGS